MLKNRPLFRPSALLLAAWSQALSRGVIITASLGALVWVQSANAETFYKWVDKDGSTHYTQTPPSKTGVRSARKVYIDNMAPPTPVAPPNAENYPGNPTSEMNASQLANAATNGSVPDGSVQPQNPVANPVPQQQIVAPPQQVITPIPPPPANRLIVPTQDQVRPAFNEQ